MLQCTRSQFLQELLDVDSRHKQILARVHARLDQYARRLSAIQKDLVECQERVIQHDPSTTLSLTYPGILPHRNWSMNVLNEFSGDNMGHDGFGQVVRDDAVFRAWESVRRTLHKTIERFELMSSLCQMEEEEMRRITHGNIGRHGQPGSPLSASHRSLFLNVPRNLSNHHLRHSRENKNYSENQQNISNYPGRDYNMDMQSRHSPYLHPQFNPFSTSDEYHSHGHQSVQELSLKNEENLNLFHQFDDVLLDLQRVNNDVHFESMNEEQRHDLSITNAQSPPELDVPGHLYLPFISRTAATHVSLITPADETSASKESSRRRATSVISTGFPTSIPPPPPPPPLASFQNQVPLFDDEVENSLSPPSSHPRRLSTSSPSPSPVKMISANIPTNDTGRSALLDAIRHTGGVAYLQKRKQTKKPSTTRATVKPEDSIDPSMDLMTALTRALQLRRNRQQSRSDTDDDSNDSEGESMDGDRQRVQSGWDAP